MRSSQNRNLVRPGSRASWNVAMMGAWVVALTPVGACGGSPPRNAAADDRDANQEAPDATYSRRSLAGIEDVTPEGRLEERPSLRAGIRLLCLIPVSPDGSTLFEILGVPEDDAVHVVAGVRSLHPAPRHTDCDRLQLAIDGTDKPLVDAEYLQGPAALGAMETVRAMATIDEIRSMAEASTLRVAVCDQRYSFGHEAMPALQAFVERFAELAGSSASTDEPPAQPPSQDDDGRTEPTTEEPQR